MKIANTSQVHFKPSYICVYGCSGIGKTTLASTLPQGEVLLLDAESGIASLRGTQIDTIPLAKDDTGALVPEEKRYERLLKFNEFIQLESTKQKYKYIVIDSLTEIAQNIKKKFDQEYEGFKAWGEYTNAMLHLLKFYRDLGHYTIVFLSLEGRLEDESGNAFAYPDIGGKKAKEYLLPAFDEVFRMIVDGEKKRWLVTQTTAKTQAKDRSGKLAELEAPNLGAIINKMREE
jgi:hypothetical protein